MGFIENMKAKLPSEQTKVSDAKKATDEKMDAEAKKAKTIKWVVGGILLLVVGVVTVKMLKRK